jgi:hypothetical protein
VAVTVSDGHSCARAGSPIVSTVRTRIEDTRRLVVESVALGLGFTAVLIFGGSALVAAFSPYEAYPYWSAIPHLRTDTSGFLAFAVALVSLAVSKYLELRRRGDLGDTPVKPVSRPAGVHAVQAVAEAAAVCATGLVIYLSLNAVVHPWTLRIQLTHLWPWPSEGTARAVGLAVCWAAVATRHYLRATARRPSGAAPSEAAPAPEMQRDRMAGPPPEMQRDRMAGPPDWPARPLASGQRPVTGPRQPGPRPSGASPRSGRPPG